MRELEAPQTLLQLLIRRRDASYEGVVRELGEFARRRGIDGTISARHLQRLARRERATSGRPTALPGTRRLLAEFFGRPFNDLVSPLPLVSEATGITASNGLEVPTLTPAADAVPVITSVGQLGSAAPTVDTPMVDYFRNVFVQHVLADNLMGPHHLVEVVRAQAQLLDQVLPDARGAVRSDLLLLACRYNEFAGWLYQDAGQTDHAMAYTDRAMDYSLEIGDPNETGYVLMRKTHIACDSSRPDRALGLADAALRDADRTTPQIRALILGQRGRALALLGESDEFARTLDRAFEEISRPTIEPDERAGFANVAYVELEAAGSWSELGQPATAIPIFERSYSNLPAHQRRDRGVCLTRLATAHAAQHDKDQACATGRAAVEVVQSATSARALRELQQLSAHLDPWEQDDEVVDLIHQIRGLLKSA